MTPLMKRLFSLAWLAAIATLPFSQGALAQRAKYEEMIATHAKANLVPEALVHRVIVRESKYQASLLGSGGAIGLMQIKLATARSLGYTGTAEGLRDPATNLTVRHQISRRRLSRRQWRPRPRRALLRRRLLLRRQAPAARTSEGSQSRALDRAAESGSRRRDEGRAFAKDGSERCHRGPIRGRCRAGSCATRR